MPQTATPPSNTVMDTALLEEIVFWIKSMTSVGVSPDMAAKVTSKFFLAALDTVGYDDDDDDAGEEFFEE